MASFRSAFMLAVLLSATASALFGCGEKKDTKCKNFGIYRCYCPQATPGGPIFEGTQVCLDGAYTACECGGAGAAGTGTVSANGGASGSGLPDGVPATTTDTVNAGDKAQAGEGGSKEPVKEVVPEGKCPTGFTCQVDQVYKTKTMCTPADPNALLCATDDDCTKIGLDVICMQGPGFNACVKFCDP
jgi:hypothetical protein